MNKLIFLCLIIFPSIALANGKFLPVASTETPVASTGKSCGGLSINSVARSEISVARSEIATPKPSPTPDLVEDLCAKATREVEASRIREQAKDVYIDSLEKKSKLDDDMIKGQADLLNEYRQLNADRKASESADHKLLINMTEQRDNALLQRDNIQKQLDVEKMKKKFPITPLGIIVGIAIKAIFL